MKKRLAILLLSAVLLLTGCGAYFLDEVLPELMDISTQYPNVESVTVTELASGDTVTYAEPDMQDNIRMLFEGVQCTREKTTVGAEDAVYTVEFKAQDGDTVIYVISGSEHVIGEYKYKAITFGVDMIYLENLFE